MDKLEMDLLSRLLVAMKECKVRRKDRDGDQQLCEVVTNVVTKNTTHLGGEPNTKLCLNKFLGMHLNHDSQLFVLSLTLVTDAIYFSL